MTQFMAINPGVEVSGSTVLSFMNSMEQGRETRKKILKNHGIDPDPKVWYKQQAWLNAYKEVYDSLGQMNLFLIGKAVIKNAEFPPMKNLEEALHSINIAYHMNHRLNGKIMFNPEDGSFTPGIGHYKLEQYDAKQRKAVVVCRNPYPSKFDEGILTQLARTFKPQDSVSQKITLDETRETRRNGGSSCTFLIQW